jgi:CRP/FNR family transcriptional regulator
MMCAAESTTENAIHVRRSLPETCGMPLRRASGRGHHPLTGLHRPPLAVPAPEPRRTGGDQSFGGQEKERQGKPAVPPGDPADELFLIKGGRLKLSKVFEDGREVTLDIRKSGDFVGETLLSEAADYPVSAWRLEDTLTCGFDRRQFEQLVLAHPRIGLQIIRNMSERIPSLTDRLGGLAGGPIQDRLLQTLVDLSRDHGVSHRQGRAIQLSLTHEDLSFLIGAHRVSVTRAIRDLKRSGKVITDGRHLIIPN